MRYKGLLIITLSLLVLPSFALAFTTPNVWDPSILKGPLVTCHGAPVDVNSDGTFTTNPAACQSLCDFIATFINVAYWFIGFVIWILAPIFLTVGGIMFLISGSNPEMIGAANKTFTGTIVGILIVLLAWIIVNTFISAIGIAGIGGFGTSACNIAPPVVPGSPVNGF